MPSRVNRLMVKEAVDEFRDAGGLVAVAYEKISAEDSAALRRKLREGGAGLKVVKNRTTRTAMEELGRGEFGAFLDGQTAVVVAPDAVEAAKAATEFCKQRKLDLKGGWSEGRTLSADEVKRLAAVPSRMALLGQLAGVINAPLTKLTGMIQAPYASIARAMKAWNDKREGGEAQG